MIGLSGVGGFAFEVNLLSCCRERGSIRESGQRRQPYPKRAKPSSAASQGDSIAVVTRYHPAITLPKRMRQ